MLNKCIFIGRLTRNPEIRQAGEAKTAKFTIAVTRRYKKKDEEKPSADFIPVTVWHGSAEFAEKYLEKGKQIYVTGALETYSYEKDGEMKYAFCINADEIGFADTKKSGETETKAKDSDTAKKDDFPEFGEVFEEFGDDLPF